MVMMLLAFLTGKSMIRLPNIFSNGVVLQQKTDIQLWGWASPNEKIKNTPLLAVGHVAIKG